MKKKGNHAAFQLENGVGICKSSKRMCVLGSSCCCCPDSASPTASVSPPAAFRPLGLQLWTKQACNQKGELRGAPASPTCLRPEHGHCKGSGASWGAGCSAIVTAAPERARKDGGVTFLSSVPEPPSNPIARCFWEIRPLDS